MCFFFKQSFYSLKILIVGDLIISYSVNHQGEFNSGKSTVINALLGGRFLKEGVVPTTNEITFLRYSEVDSGETQRCERHPDGQYIRYLPAKILNKVSTVFI